MNEELTPLVQHLRQGVAGLGLDLLTPAEAEYASGIVSFAHPKAEEMGAALEREGVIVWAGDGRVRASVHLYNDSTDIERYIQTLESVLTRLEPSHA